MRNIAFLMLTFIVSNVFIHAQKPLVQALHTGWKFKQARLTNWYPATVPGVVHTDLLNNGIIEDPYYRLNERGVQWIDKEDWIYETNFNVTPEMMQKGNIRLQFKGLDTYADVYLNDEKIITANNMFREWQADIKSKLKHRGNVLKIYFHSPIKMDIPKWDSLPYQLEAGNDQSENGGIFNKKVSVFARKAGYHYGWDWGPRLVTSGIWRPVFLEGWDNARIENVFFNQKNVTAKKAAVTAIVEVLADNDMSNAEVEVALGAGKKLAVKKINFKKGMNRVEVPFIITNPKLWWSNGLGEAYLYDFTTNLSINSKIIDSETEKIGLRSIKIINKPDQYGKTFYIELNGRPVFAKGANYIPNDMFLPRVTNEKYEKVILDAVNANMNMLRVWGGGIYENKIFYDLCDKYGIMVWQDFMYACSLYPAEGALLENMRQEAIENVRRLRNHPSIALWCGNNENGDAWFGWGWKENYEKQNPKYAETIWNQYVQQFHVMLPEVVKEYDPSAFYWPSSPYSEFGKRANDHSGDRHYWGVWHAREPIAKYNDEKSRFFSEYGFQSFPEFESVKLYAPKKEDWDIYSEVMMAHQRGGKDANGRIETYLLNEYRKPENFESFLYMNQVLQGDAIKTAMEAHRRDMPYCMGSLYWQHNDVWPVASWSARDYYGRWKAQQYFAKEAYKDLLISPVEKDGKLNVYIVLDRMNGTNGLLEVSVIKLTGEKIYTSETNVRIPANASTKQSAIDINEMLKGMAREEVVVHVKFLEKNKKPYTNNYFLTKQKDINYPVVNIARKIKPTKDGYEITLTSDHFARAVFMSINGIDNFFENNYFDILPGQAVTTKVQTKLSQAEFEKQLKIISLVDAY